MAAAFGIVAPSLGVQSVPEAPTMPYLNDLNTQGNVSLDFAFDETKDVIAFQDVTFTAFNPDKKVELNNGLVTNHGIGDGFKVRRVGSVFFIPIWYVEPLSTLQHQKLGNDAIMVQEIQDLNTNETSTFIVDDGNKQYECFISFSPLAGYTTLLESYNIGHGFSVRLFGNAYGAPSWSDQLVNILGFLGSLVAYFVYFCGYIVLLLAVMFQILGLVGGIGAGVVILLGILFFGSLLMFLRGLKDN